MMHRGDISGALVHDGERSGDVRQGAWGDRSVGHPGADLQTSGAELVKRSAQKPVNQQLFDKRNSGHRGCDGDVETGVTSQAAGIVMQLENFEENDDNRDGSDTNARDQQVTTPYQVKSSAKLSTPVAAWGCDSYDDGDKSDGCDINGATPGQLQPSELKSPCIEEESLANKPVESRKRRSILRRASSLWRSKSQVDLHGCNTESNVGDDDAPTKKSFRLFKKAKLKLAAVKRFEEGPRGKKGKESVMKKGAVSQSMSNIHIQGDDGGTSVISEVPPKKTLGLFKKAALKVRAVKRFEDSVKDRGKTEEDALAGNEEDTGLPCLDEVKEPHSDLSEVSPHEPAKKSFSLFKKVTSKLTASKRLEANGREDEEERLGQVDVQEDEVQEDEEQGGDRNDVSHIMDNVVAYDGGNIGMLDLDSDDVADDDFKNDDHESSVSSFVMDGRCDTPPAVIRNTTMMAWGTEVDCDDNLSLSSCDRFTVNGGAPKWTADTETLQAEVEVKGTSTPKRNNQARGRFKKALTFLKAMNGFRGGSKTSKDIDSAIIEEVAEKSDVVSPVACVDKDVVSSERELDCDVVSPFTCADQGEIVVSSYVQVWDGEMSSEEEDTVQCVEPDRPVSKTDMYASILELSSDESSNQSDDDDAHQSDDDDVSDGSSGLALHEPCDVIDRLGEEPVITKEVTDSSSIVSDKGPKENNGKRKIKRAFLMAKIVGLFKTKSSSSTKTLAVQLPEDGASGSVANFDQHVPKSDRCDSDGKSARSLTGDCSDGEQSMPDTDEAIESASPEISEDVSDVNVVCEKQSSPSSQINISPCHIAIPCHLTPNCDDMPALSGSDTSQLTSNLSVPASLSADVLFDKPAVTESNVVKRWKWFSQKKKANKKPNDVEVQNTTAGQFDLPTADDSHDATADGHVLLHGGCHQVECGACDTCDR